MGAALVVTLVRPATWVVALAGLLAGGGLVVVAAPILVLPTPTGLQNTLGAPVSTLVFGDPSSEFIALVVGTVIAGVLMLGGGLLAGSWAERRSLDLVLEAAADEGFLPVSPDLAAAPGTLAVAAVRLLSLLPPLVAAAIAWPTLYAVTYDELILPGDLATPLPIRVIARIAPLLAGIVVTWLLADAAAAVGVRRLVLERRGVVAAWALGWAGLIRRPHRVLGTAVVGVLVTALAAGPALTAAVLGWGQVRELLAIDRDPLAMLVAVATWVAIWLGALALAGVGAAFRTAAWTMEGVGRA
jgi:hypothetical protein